MGKVGKTVDVTMKIDSGFLENYKEKNKLHYHSVIQR